MSLCVENEFEINVDLARRFYQNKDYESAKRCIEKALKYNEGKPLSEEFLSNAALIYKHTNNLDKAYEYINKAIVINPNYWRYYSIKASICYLMDDKNGKNQYKNCTIYAVTIAIKYANRDEIGEARGYLSRMYFEMKDYKKALEEAELAIELGDKTENGKYVRDNLENISSSKSSNTFYSRQKLNITSTQTDLVSYVNEKCNCMDDIFALRDQLLLRIDREFNGNYGWVLAKKQNFNSVDNANNLTLYVLNINGTFECYLSEFANNDEPYCIYETYNEGNMYTLMYEFDYSGYYKNQYNEGDRIHNMQYFAEYGSHSLTRLYEKGVGLLVKLEEILSSDIKPILINVPSSYVELGEIEKKEQIKLWQNNGKCRYCGGDFSGFISKKCSSCGKLKDY